MPPRIKKHNASDYIKKAGEIRRSQTVSTYGSGALVDFPRLSGIMAGIDYWKVTDGRLPDDAQFQERNLQKMLGKDFFVQVSTDENADKKFSIPVYRFPSYYYCPECHELDYYYKIRKPESNNTEYNKPLYCSKCKTADGKPVALIPSRFVVACPNGHIDEFPYSWWVHRGSDKQCDGTQLFLEYKAFNPEGEILQSILYKVNRNFLMQMLVTSCKKMQVYHVDDSQDWNLILDTYREALLNEHYVLSDDIQEVLGKGAVLSFRKSLISRKTSFKEDSINFIEIPESDEFGLILKDVTEIYSDIREKRTDELMIFDEIPVQNLTGDLSKLQVSKLETDTQEEPEEEQDSEVNDDVVTGNETVVEDEPSDNIEIEEDIFSGMKILFGTNEQDGKAVLWTPNDTSQLFHTNTGIIGTMGTGKTQFTKSLITQLYRQQKNNVEGKELGILIFDYKGDYNESKADFVAATNATIYKPYQLPFNPLALTKSAVFKPLLPTHTANAFKDTISKVYNLGPKQQNTLLQCIMDTYTATAMMEKCTSTVHMVCFGVMISTI